jgi:IclR family KDG regulon transcriptional repressor
MAVKSASRVIDILELLGENPDGLTHGDIARRLSLPKSSLTAVLNTMAERRFTEFDPRSARHSLGSALLSLSGVYLRRTDLPRLAQPIVAKLMLQTGESAALMIIEGAEAVVVCKENCDKAILYSLQLGNRGPVHASAGGKAILALRPREDVRALLGSAPLRAVTPRSITDPETLIRQLDTIAATGIAFSREEMVAGIIAMGAAVRDTNGEPCAGISVGVPLMRFTRQRERNIALHLRAAADEIAQRLGWDRDRQPVSRASVPNHGA